VPLYGLYHYCQFNSTHVSGVMRSPWVGQLKNFYLIPGKDMRFSSSNCLDLLGGLPTLLQWTQESLSLRVRQVGCESIHCPALRAAVKNKFRFITGAHIPL